MTSSSSSSENNLSSQTCNTCFITKDLTDFGKMMRSDNGYNPKCKVCVKNKVKCIDHKCSKCKELKPLTEFNNTCRVCNSCRKDYAEERKNFTEKQCRQCKETKAINKFYKSKNSLDGKGSYCKSYSCKNSNYVNRGYH
jgi:hypothetical protein